MLRRVAGIIVLVSLVSGCGTINNHMCVRIYEAETHPRETPYGGVQLCAERAWTRAVRSHDISTALVILFVDLPFSAVFDTVLLPYDIVRTIQGDEAPISPDRSSAAPPQ